MGRGLDGYIFFSEKADFLDPRPSVQFSGPGAWCAAVHIARRRAAGGHSPFSVAIARGKHLFPFRTEKLSPSAPMVLGPQGPGRVGRRRSSLEPPKPGGSSFFTIGPLVG